SYKLLTCVEIHWTTFHCITKLSEWSTYHRSSGKTSNHLVFCCRYHPLQCVLSIPYVVKEAESNDRIDFSRKVMPHEVAFDELTFGACSMGMAELSRNLEHSF